MLSREAASGTVAQLMADFRKGDREAAKRLVEVLYPELRSLAAAKMRGERAGHTWQPTLLVNELYLALVKIKALHGGTPSGDEQEKAAFLALAGQMMQRLLIDHARPMYRRVEKVEILEATLLASNGSRDLQWVEQALSRLESIEPKFRSVVEMRVFEGLTVDETARQLGCSPRSVATYWTFAKRWLANELATSPSVNSVSGD